MLEFLVTSKARRRLFVVLWGQQRAGSVAELAAMADVAASGAHGELKEMLRLGLVVATKTSSKELFRANAAHPAAELLSKLARLDVPVRLEPTKDEEELKQQLVTLGAPLRGVEAARPQPKNVARTLVEGVRLARRDAVVARTLPLCFWACREQLNGRSFEELALTPEDKHALGFFLELTGELGGDRRLNGLAETFHDLRLTKARPFFHSTTHVSPRSFALAEKWGFSMNMELGTFRMLFDKYVSE